MRDRVQNIKAFHKGVTFLELLVTIAIIGILAAIAVPYYGDYIERQRWVGAAEAVYGQMQQAKRLAISNNKTVYFIAATESGGDWCVTYSEDPSSACTNGFVTSSAANPAVSISGVNYPNMTLSAKSSSWPVKIGFVMPGLGISTAETMVITSSLGDIEVEAAAGMNVRICSDDYGRYKCN